MSPYLREKEAKRPEVSCKVLRFGTVCLVFIAFFFFAL